MLNIALEQVAYCPKVKFFSVGCLILCSNSQSFISGYTEEVQHMHAEEVAIHKAKLAQLNLQNATLYSTLEPCSVRLSAKTSCTDRIIESGISRVVYGCREPSEFVDCVGHERLLEHGIVVQQAFELEKRCLISIHSKRDSN